MRRFRPLVTAGLAALLLVASAPLALVGVASAHGTTHATYHYGPPGCSPTKTGHVDRPGTWTRWPVGIGSTCWAFAPARTVPPLTPAEYSGQYVYIGACTKPRDLATGKVIPAGTGLVFHQPPAFMTCTLTTYGDVLHVHTYVWGAPPTEYRTAFQDTYIVIPPGGATCDGGWGSDAIALPRYMSQEQEMFYFRTGPRKGKLAFTRDLRWNRRNSPTKVLISTGKMCS